MNSPLVKQLLMQQMLDPATVDRLNQMWMRGQAQQNTQSPDFMGPPKPGNMPMAPQGPPPGPVVAKPPIGLVPPVTPIGGPRQMTPDQKAIIDAMTGARVHKDMSGRQMGMEGVSPAMRYMLYAMKGRRHKDMAGRDVY